MSLFVENIVDAIQNVVGEGGADLHQPIFEGNEIKYLTECIESTFVSSVGRFVDTFEDQIAAYTDSKRAIAVSNGTAALHVALKISGVMKNDEVLVPSLSFVATANAVNYNGATPHFVDSELKTLGICPISLRSWLKHSAEKTNSCYRNKKTGRRIKAIVPMHTFGHCCNMDAILAIAKDYRMEVVEDAAEAIGSYYNSTHAGTMGALGVISFNGNKTITTGGGGVILTNNDKYADYAKHITTTAKLNHQWNYVHDEIGFNYRMPNINAALGCAQLEKLEEILFKKRKLYNEYKESFRSTSGVTIFQEPIFSTSNYWLQAILLDNDSLKYKNDILRKTNNVGIKTRPVWSLLNNLKPFKNCPRAPLPNAEFLEKAIVCLPSGADIL